MIVQGITQNPNFFTQARNMNRQAFLGALVIAPPKPHRELLICGRLVNAVEQDTQNVAFGGGQFLFLAQ